VDSVLEHVVDEVRIGFDEVIEHLQLLDFLAFVVVEKIEVNLIAVELHVLHRVDQILFLFLNLFVPLFDLFLFLLQLSDLFVDLLFHHLVKVLLLNIKLLHNSSKRLF